VGGGLAHVAGARDVLRRERAGLAAGQRDRAAGAGGGGGIQRSITCRLSQSNVAVRRIRRRKSYSASSCDGFIGVMSCGWLGTITRSGRHGRIVSSYTRAICSNT
jgi:hypothetical protein